MRQRLAILLLAALPVATGCIGPYDDGGGLPANNDNGGGNGGGGGGGGGGNNTGGGGTANPVADFAAKVAPILVGTTGTGGACGACHAVPGGSGPGFLIAKPDLYTTLINYPGLIGDSPQNSRLYAKGVHEGPGFDATQAPIVAAWIVEYNQYKASSPADGGVAAPTIAPFVPTMGANTIDLSSIDSKLAGQTITFTAQTVGTSIELTQLTVHAVASLGVHMVHPLWVIWDDQMKPSPDPADSFSNLDQTVFNGTTVVMGPGTLFLPGWTATSKLNVVFSKIESKSSVGGVVAACKNLANFTTNVKPLLQQNCNTCHTGATPTAGLSFAFNGTNDADVCKNALSEINTTTPAMSLLLSKPNPGVNDAHPRKVNPFAAFQTAVTNWINLEK